MNNQHPHSGLTHYKKSNLKKIPHFQSSGDIILNSGSKILGESEISIKPLNNFGNQKQPKIGTGAENSYVSPPSQLPNHPFKRDYGPSVLDKSNSSIAKMSQSQKKDYATQKLLELDNIAELYDQSGGMSGDFRKNL